MTLDKNINILCERFDFNKKVGVKSTTFVFKTKDIGDLLHQLRETKTLREELERTEKELEAYKKALDLACDDVRCVQPNTFCKKCPLDSDDDMCFKNEVKQNYYLQKAREEE